MHLQVTVADPGEGPLLCFVQAYIGTTLMHSLTALT